MRRTSGSLAPALARTRATSGRAHRRARVSDVNRRVVILLRIVARVVGVVGGVGVVRIVIIIAPECLVRSRAACESNSNSNSTYTERPFDETRWKKKTRASVLPFDARDDVVTTSSSRHRARAHSFHAIPCHSLGPIDRWASECVVFYLLRVRGRCVRRRWVVCFAMCRWFFSSRYTTHDAIASTRVVRRDS